MLSITLEIKQNCQRIKYTQNSGFLNRNLESQASEMKLIFQKRRSGINSREFDAVFSSQLQFKVKLLRRGRGGGYFGKIFCIAPVFMTS